MTSSRPARRSTRRIRRRRIRGAGLLVAVAAIAGYQSLASSSLPASPTPTLPSPIPVLRGEPRAAPGEADDAAPAPRRTLVEVRGVADLDRALVRALRRAATDAAGDGVELRVRSGRRSPEHQEQLFREAISKYGSPQEAARWVATPATSSHVSGDAADIAPSAATAWLSAHGAEYGLCQIYANEPWHYELRPDAAARGCPPMYPDPTHDPRMQQP